MKTALITGGSAGFGKCVAEKLLHRGYTVYACARRVELMRDLADGGAHVLHMDVTDDASVAEGVERIMAEQGRIDILLNNAGYGSYGAVECVPLSEVKRQFDVNVFGAARLNQAVLPHMRAARSGRIINVSSVTGLLATPVIGWYAATKHALEGMSDALRVEVRKHGIHVVLIEPGVVKTCFDEVAFETLDRVNHPEDYRGMVRTFRYHAEGMYTRGQGPERTAETIIRAMEARRPRARYRTTYDGKLLPWAKRLLGTRVCDWVLSSQLR